MGETALPPATWPIVGHERHVERLRQMVLRSQFPLAILVTGAPQVGRKALANQFAAAALCADATNGNPCGRCRTCTRIAAGSHPDVALWSLERQEIESGASKSAALTIESVRRIAASTALRPHEGGRRFIIIEDADTLGDAAQQALLKTLEDSPAFATIILIATSASSMLETVRSRCTEVALQLVPTAEIASRLDHPDRASIAALAAGRPGWAIKASRVPEWLDHERESISAIESWLRMPSAERLVEAYRRGDLYLRDEAAGRSSGDKRESRVVRYREKAITDLNRISLTWRDIALTRAGLPQFAFDPGNADRLVNGSSAVLADWYRALTATRQCIQDLTGNIRPRLAMQAMVNRWPTLS